MRLNQFADPSPPEGNLRERRLEAVREMYVAVMPSATFFAMVVIVSSIAVFWSHASHVGLLVWGSLVAIGHLVGFPAAMAQTRFHWLRLAVCIEVLSGVAWALLPVLALPADPSWQAMQGVILVGLLLSTMSNATALLELHLASTIPMSIIASLAFLFGGTGAAVWMALVFGIALPFTITAGAILRQTQMDLFTASIRSETLADELRSESERLQDVNGQLESVNSHLDELARTDSLTGLPNRTDFNERLKEAVANPLNTEIVVCYLDLDGFKRVNDAFGHGVGDVLLCYAAERLNRLIRPGDLLARQGGDELTILRTSGTARHELEAFGRRVVDGFKEPFMIDGKRLQISASVGIVALEEKTSAADLMRFADTALYEAKAEGGRTFKIFNDAMRAKVDDRMRLEAELGLALDCDEITPYLQPIVDINSGRIASAEALLRWEHVDGVRSAGQFIEVAKGLGLIDRINKLVVNGVRDFQRDLNATDVIGCPINVNVSPMNFEQMLDLVLADRTLDPLRIEITEDGVFADMDDARVLLARARAGGADVLLDDFGVGFASLSTAVELPVDGFKIDRGFVASIEESPSARAAIEAIIQLADRMGLHVVAEGVETIDQLRLLQKLGVGYAQGFLFAPAVSRTQFHDWLSEKHNFGHLVEEALLTPELSFNRRSEDHLRLTSAG